MNNELKWQSDSIPNRPIKPLSPTILRQLGIASPKPQMVENLEELKKSPPNIIIAKSTAHLKFMQNYFKQQVLNKNTSYVMGLGVFQQLSINPQIQNKKSLLKPSGSKFSQFYKPYRGQDLTDKTLLVFRTGGIGDLLFIQPNLTFLKEKYPTCKIIFACGPQYQAMVDNWKCIDEVIDLPFQFSYLRDADYHALFEGVIERCKLAETENSYRLFTTWMGLNLPDERLTPTQEVKSDKIEFCKETLEKWGLKEKGFILMQLKASSPIRTPRPTFWANMIRKLVKSGYKVVLTDNPRQADYVDKFIISLNDSPYDSSVQYSGDVFNFCRHSKTLDYSIAMVSLAKMVIATDSAMVHIAASLGTKIYGIYGPFPGHIRLDTYKDVKWVDAQKECSPCYIHSQNPCPKAGLDGFSPCYDNIDLDKVVDEVSILYEGN